MDISTELNSSEPSVFRSVPVYVTPELAGRAAKEATGGPSRPPLDPPLIALSRLSES